MATVTELYARKGSRPLLACDFSPPRSGQPEFVEKVRALDVDFICVAYSPGRAVRLDSAVAAALIKERTGKEVIFNLATRDMNKLAIQTHLLGAQALNLQNVVVVKGDDFSEKDLARLKDVSDYRPTDLIQAIRAMNEGLDFKGLKLQAATGFCVGATADLGKGIEREARLVQRKIAAGAQFLITQSVYDAGQVTAFLECYQDQTGEPLDLPVFYGVPILEREGVVFGDVPERVQRELEQGRPGLDIALELVDALTGAGCQALYLIPPILRGGARAYEAVGALLDALQVRQPRA